MALAMSHVGQINVASRGNHVETLGPQPLLSCPFLEVPETSGVQELLDFFCLPSGLLYELSPLITHVHCLLSGDLKHIPF